ncbi:MAG: TVP38/TMEM64 family protein [Nanobdellota archaeon]
MRIAQAIAFVLAIATIAYTVNALGLLKLENLRYLVDATEPWGVVVFVLIYIAITLTNIPASIFTISAGVLFDLPVALAAAVIASTTSAIIAFFIARHLFGDAGRFAWLTKKIEEQAASNGFTTVAILRLSFLPYMPLSYAAGLVKNLRARDFILATFLTNIHGNFIFIILGASFTESLPWFLAAIVLVLSFTQGPRLIRKYEQSKTSQ